MFWDLDLCLDHRDMPLIPFHYIVSTKRPSASVLESFRHCTELEPDIHLLDYTGVPVIPFDYAVSPKSPSPPVLEPFYRFADLPADIHFLIFQLCDIPTLFQPINTCSYIRHASSKIFWARLDNLWFPCQHDIIRAYMSNQVGLVRHCPHFASRITQVEIYGGLMGRQFDGDQLSTAKKVRKFWEMVQSFFPSVRRVVLSDIMMTPEKCLAELERGNHGGHSLFSALLDLTPLHTTLFFAFSTYRYEACQLYRVGPGPSWHVVESPWRPKRAVLPERKFPSGPVAEYMAMERLLGLARLEESGLRWLRAETYLRYSEGHEIDCPASKCDAIFTDKVRWKNHIRQSCHSKELFCHCNTPVKVKAVLEGRQDHLEAIQAIYRSLWIKLYGELGGNGTEERCRFEEAVFAQMKEEKCLVPGESLDESPLWARFYGFFDDNSVYWKRMP